jgi:hypothetical protein
VIEEVDVVRVGEGRRSARRTDVAGGLTEMPEVDQRHAAHRVDDRRGPGPPVEPCDDVSEEVVDLAITQRIVGLHLAGDHMRGAALRGQNLFHPQLHASRDRIELRALSADDFRRILSEPKPALTKQYTALLGTEGVELQFTDDGVTRIAEVAFQVNERTENIGARRLHTVLERLLDAISFDASDHEGGHFVIDAAYVDLHLGELVKDEDLSRYIL